MSENTQTQSSDQPVDPYQNENSSFDGAREKPEQTEEQLSLAYDCEEFLRDVIDLSWGSTLLIWAWYMTFGLKKRTERHVASLT